MFYGAGEGTATPALHPSFAGVTGTEYKNVGLVVCTFLQLRLVLFPVCVCRCSAYDVLHILKTPLRPLDTNNDDEFDWRLLVQAGVPPLGLERNHVPVYCEESLDFIFNSNWFFHFSWATLETLPSRFRTLPFFSRAHWKEELNTG